MVVREIEKDRAKQNERRKRKDGASAAGSEDLKEPLCGTVRHIQSVVSSYIDPSANLDHAWCEFLNCWLLQIRPGCSITEFFSQAGLAPPTSVISPSPYTAEVCSEKEEGGASRRHILVGLHTCGDLGATMMRVFRESEEIAGLVSLGCCYMKLSSQEDCSNCSDRPSSSSTDSKALGYPLSDFVSSLLPSSSLSYEAREVACHSIDSYSRQLQQGTY